MGTKIDRKKFISSVLEYFNAFNETVTFDNLLENARASALLSALVYLEPEDIDKFLSKSKFTHFRLFKSETQVALVLWNEKHMGVVFRGTDEKNDWTFNLSLMAKNTVNGYVHRGFYNALDALWNDIYQFVSKELGSRKLFISGHSLGGALAVVAASRFAENDIEVEYLLTFGQPKVWRYFPKWDQIDTKVHNYYRFTTNFDLISGSAFNFFGRHSGYCCYFDRKNRLCHNPCSLFIWFDRFLGLSQELIERRSGLKVLRDHNIFLYTARINIALLHLQKESEAA